VADDEGDSLRAIIRIPTAPLLHYLENPDPGDADSGIDTRSRSHRDTLSSTDTHYSSDRASTADEGVGGVNLLAPPTNQNGHRSSIHSEISECGSSGRSIMR